MTCIPKTLRDIASDLMHIMEELRRGEPPNYELLSASRHRIEAQAEMLEEGLHEC